MHTLSDEELMLAYASGDLDAFGQLYQRHKGGVYRYLLRQTRDQSLAEDLFQEVWGKVIKGAERYQPSAKFSTWVYTLAHNKLVDEVRHLKVVQRVIPINQGTDQVSEAVGEDAPVSAALEQAREAVALKHCLEKLPQLQLDSFLLKEEAGLTVNDIATVLGANKEATKSRLRYAYQSLRDCLMNRLGRVVA